MAPRTGASPLAQPPLGLLCVRQMIHIQLVIPTSTLSGELRTNTVTTADGSRGALSAAAAPAATC